jgi:hypothetical protein
VASVLLTHENLSEDKHVEGLLFPCLDEGSTPSSSTDCFNQKAKPKKTNPAKYTFCRVFSSSCYVWQLLSKIKLNLIQSAFRNYI